MTNEQTQKSGATLHWHSPGPEETLLSGPAARASRESPFLPAVTEGLPTLPGYVFELSQLLAAQQVDLNRVTQVIRTDPSLTAQLLRMWNSSGGGANASAETLEEIVVLLGRERLRTLVLTCSLMRQSDRAVAVGDLEVLWQHSFLTARLSEALARELRFPQTELAYLAGLLHDIGRLALLEMGFEHGLTPEETCTGHDQPGREAPGMNHCAAGRALGIAWNFPAPLIEAIERHHEPERATLDPLLVSIVALADQFCDAHGVDFAAAANWQLPSAGEFQERLKTIFPQFSSQVHQRLLHVLRSEWMRLIPAINSRTMPHGRTPMSQLSPAGAGPRHK
jgi:putative nucleotidyltransferase with HDIG domain